MTQPHLTINLFGPPTFSFEDGAIPLSRRKAVALLAYLAVTQQPHSRDHLAALLWPEATAEKARASLRNTLYSIKKTELADWLTTENELVSLTPFADGVIHVDVLRFNDLVAQWQTIKDKGDDVCGNEIEILEEAVGLYSADFLTGFSLPDSPQFDDWQFFQAETLRKTLAQHLNQLILCQSEQNLFEEAIGYARKLLALDELHEPAHRQLMQLYAQSGQQSAAMRQFERCQKVLQDELGVEVSAETRDLYRQLTQGQFTPTGLISQSTITSIPNNLPPSASRFVGRENELNAVNDLLDEPTTRLITVLGPGGIGKTRFALTIAQQQIAAKHFSDGVYFVPLASIENAGLIVAAIIEVLELQLSETGEPPQQQLLNYLANKSILLILDNFEHLIDGADFVAELSQNSPKSKIIATSRQRLNLYEEYRFPLEGLPYGSSEQPTNLLTFAAPKLLTQCIRRHQPDFVATDQNSTDILELCRLLDGMPLALELAASRSIVLSLEEPVVEVKENLDILQTDLRNVPVRHRSMRASFDGSWRALNSEQQAIYAKLSIFRGGFSREAARKITDASTVLLTHLVNHSLLRFSPRTQRFDVHELLRQFSAENLTPNNEITVRDGHSDYYCTKMQQINAELKSDQFTKAMRWIDEDYDNLQSGWQWVLKHKRISLLTKMVEPMCLYYRWRYRLRDGADFCREAINQLSSGKEKSKNEERQQTNLTLTLLNWLAAFAHEDMRFATYATLTDVADQAMQQAKEIIAQTDRELIDSGVYANYLLRRSIVAARKRYDGEAIDLNEESLKIFRTIDDKWDMAEALDVLSIKERVRGNREKAYRLHEECISLRNQIGNPFEIARSHSYMGLFNLHINRFAEADVHFNKALIIFQRLGYEAAQVRPLVFLTINEVFRGEYEACLKVSQQAHELNEKYGSSIEKPTIYMGFIESNLNLGNYDEARRIAHSILPQFKEMNQSWSIGFTFYHLGRLAIADNAFDEAQRYLAESLKTFAHMTEQNLLVNVQLCQCVVSVKQKKSAEFAKRLQIVKPLLDKLGPRYPMRFELIAMALWLIDQGEVLRAVEIYETARHIPHIAKSQFLADIAGYVVDAAANELPIEDVNAAREKGKTHDPKALSDVIVAEIGEQFPMND